MFYKKADNIELEGEIDDQEGVGVGVIVGEKKLMTGTDAQTNMLDVNDEEDD